MRDDKTLLLSKIILGTIIHLSLFVKYLIHIKVDSDVTFFFIFLVDLIRRFLCLLLLSRQLFAIILSGDQIVFYLSLTQMRFSSDNLYPICQKFESFWFGIKNVSFILFLNKVNANLLWLFLRLGLKYLWSFSGRDLTKATWN